MVQVPLLETDDDGSSSEKSQQERWDGVWGPEPTPA
jgi:hypothetical protein